MKFLVLGDIMGKIGRRAVANLVPTLRKEHKIDFTIANAENLAHGTGITKTTMEEMIISGVDFFTGGNHIWDKPDVYDILEDKDLRDKLIRPYNYPESTAGVGARIVEVVGKKVLIANFLGQVFMKPTLDNPFHALDKVLKKYEDDDLGAILVDFHADATSEKNAFGFYADGRVSAIWGTHSHVASADERMMPKSTAYATDVGMTGFRDGIIGERGEVVLKSFLTSMPLRHDIPEDGLAVLNALIIEVDTNTKLAKSIKRVREEIEIK